MYAEHERERIKLCNWQELYANGNWGMSQNYVDRMSRHKIESFKRLSKAKKDRIYLEKGDEIRIYLYGRDIVYKDWRPIFKRK